MASWYPTGMGLFHETRVIKLSRAYSSWLAHSLHDGSGSEDERLLTQPDQRQRSSSVWWC
jgi:hypothetical protein